MTRILIVSTCAHRLHEREFVDPIVAIIQKENYELKIVSIDVLNKKMASAYDGMIICGTALADNEYQKKIKDLHWIGDLEMPVFGVCSGMQLLASVYGAKLKPCSEIGMTTIKAKSWSKEVYAMHNFAVDVTKHFEVLASSKKCAHLIQHKTKNHGGCLFHPEVRNEFFLIDFIKSIK